MNSIKILILIVLVFIFASSKGNAQILLAGNGDPQNTYKTEKLERYSNLGTDISKHANLKIFLRKLEYRFNEMLFLDIALLARTEENLYFPTDLDIKMNVTNKSGKTLKVVGLYVVDFMKPSFVLSKDTLIIRSFRLIIGCQSDEYKVPSEITNSNDNKILFDNNLFQTQAEGCIDVDKSEQLLISAELTNRVVSIPQDNRFTKTAVGKIKSNVLNISVLQ
ncbi:MAG: hypothetical protein ACT4O9_14185 [Blastocatellia bacterium]